jgi:hypothetical protein
VAVTARIIEPRPGQLVVDGFAAAPLWTDRPYAIRRAVSGGAFGSSAERTMRILRSEGVEVVEGIVPIR